MNSINTLRNKFQSIEKLNIELKEQMKEKNDQIDAITQEKERIQASWEI